MDEKEKLEKLVNLVVELTNKQGNEWIIDSILEKKGSKKTDLNSSSKELKQIYEHCLKKIIVKQANDFYLNFKIIELKTRLINDFIRMETFRREDNFEDFCLALFQQIEAIVNFLSTEDFKKSLYNLKEDDVCKKKNKNSNQFESHRLWQLLFPFIKEEVKVDMINNKFHMPIIKWDISEKFRAILFEFYFDKKIHQYYDFYNKIILFDELYQSRNLNHRNGFRTDKQQKIIDKVVSESDRYYYKFLAFLEDFTSKINNNYH